MRLTIRRPCSVATDVRCERARCDVTDIDLLRDAVNLRPKAPQTRALNPPKIARAWDPLVPSANSRALRRRSRSRSIVRARAVRVRRRVRRSRVRSLRSVRPTRSREHRARATVRRARSRRVASPRTSSVTRFARASVGGRHSKTATRDFQRVWRGEVEPWCALDGGIVSLNA